MATIKKTPATKTAVKAAPKDEAKVVKAPKAEPKAKAEPKVDWHEGYPRVEGAFRCLVDGKEEILLHHMGMSCRGHKWSTTDCRQVIAKEILWTETK